MKKENHSLTSLRIEKDRDKVDKELTRIVNEDTSILSTPNFVSSDFWIASSSLLNKQKEKHQSCTMHPNNESNIKMQYTVFCFVFFTTKTLENQFVRLILPEEAEIQLRPT